ncbi:hypothetical protein F5B22DRAFT_328311 [Xylaria bambusicola]|uniref:uncharacterized protein n=1 Tax=Xylaria bambusicola TaxID=326684 RepID=UPI0020076DC1|nr:uncharacterized protein F5B22DRAFT_328311 [Xylaria bambusicola]KAI0509407.1 hypothetical protein F5B22DRAFT_328311 [Xylaria bambusicola]
MIQNVLAMLAVECCNSSRHIDIVSRSADRGDALRTVVLLILLVLHAIAIIPVFFYIAYTVYKVFPILTIVESRPSYEAIPLQEAGDMSRGLNSLQTEEPSLTAQMPLTSSIRRMHELVRQTDHMWLRRRGLGALAVYNLANALVIIPLRTVPLVPGFVWNAVAVLLTIQLHTVWVHVIITPPMAKPFWKRVLPFWTVFKATATASLIYYVTTELTIFTPWLAAQALRAPFGLSQIQKKPSDLWKLLLSIGLFVAIQALACAPALVILTRIQASLLPEDEETIVPVDRSFGVEKERGKHGEATGLSIIEALKSFNGSWMRLYKLCIKIFFLILGSFVGLGIILGLEYLALRAAGILV